MVDEVDEEPTGAAAESAPPPPADGADRRNDSEPEPEVEADVGPEVEADVGPEAGAVATSDDEDEAADDMGELGDDPLAGRRNALPRRVESWRTRSASGAIATALAMGLQQVFEPEKRRPAAVAEAPSDPYSDDDPITVDYVPDDAEGTIVHVKPWLLQKDEPT